jgi:arabinan endo-1,5-alpha-L-arabinosidase
VLYSPHSGYYYLFVTFGGLAANGGYNVRVARSVNPDGPYYDALGVDMADVKSNPNLPLFDDASIEPYGQKLMGNHQWVRQAGEPGSGQGTGYVSPGHNSAFYDADSGRYFIVFHTRFPGQGEYHEVRVHELFINANGWPVIAPHRWVPYHFVPLDDLPFSAGTRPWFMERCRHKDYCWNVETIGLEETPGEYKLVNHEKDISSDIKMSVRVTLRPNGTVAGAWSGEWQRAWGNRITVELDGAGRFEGVMSRGWNETSQQFVVTFSAQSAEGISLWASKLAQ